MRLLFNPFPEFCFYASTKYNQVVLLVTVHQIATKIDKPAWLDQDFTGLATTNDENSLIRHHFAGDFWINQHGWTRIFNVTATTKDENSLMRYHFVGDFRINPYL